MTAVYLFAIILAVLLAAVIIAPLLERADTDRLGAALDALREIEFEYETGKIGEADYLSLRSRFAAEAIAARDEAGSSGPSNADVCGVCEAPVEMSARFCSRCGAAVSA